MASREERSLDLCLRLDNKTFICISIPGITTTLNNLSSCCKNQHRHRHNFDETHLPYDDDIHANRFPVIVDDSKGPFPLPGITGPLFCSAVVGHTLFIVGGDWDDIQGLDDIETERDSYPWALPSPPRRNHPSPPPPYGIIHQLCNLTQQYLVPVPPVNSYSSEDNLWHVDAIHHTTTLTLNDHATPPTTTTITGHLDDRPLTTLSEDPTQIPTFTETTATASFSPDVPSPVTPDFTGTMPASPTTSPESPKNTIKGICHNIWTFDLHNPGLGWSQGKSLISPRVYPLLVPYQGKLYAFSGNHPSSLTFAEVYDPISTTWTALPPAPFRRLPDSQMFVVPLKGWDKLWVFGLHRAVDYTFDVNTRKWLKFTGARHILPHFTDLYNPVSALTPKNHMVVYWINEQEEVYAYNLSTNQLFKGVISGTDFQQGSLVDIICLHHLRCDLFCLLGCTYLLDPDRTIVHVAVLQVSLKPLPKPSKPLVLTKAPSKFAMPRSKLGKAPFNPLTATVVACFAYPLKGELGLNNAYIIINCKSWFFFFHVHSSPLTEGVASIATGAFEISALITMGGLEMRAFEMPTIISDKDGLVQEMETHIRWWQEFRNAYDKGARQGFDEP
ncbi:hypothetical protein KSS87_019764 [Heliosperma pusillum]|nr:hypothetical protein KSS87_019764 [Heliosperma pusillum]